MRDNSAEILAVEERPAWTPCSPAIFSAVGNQAHQNVKALPRTLLERPRWLEPHHLYDEAGSNLFEEICELPEYYLTRTENALLEREAENIIALAPVESIVELGAGFSKKTVHLLNAQVKKRGGGTFAPVDVSVTGLIASRKMTSQMFPELGFTGLQSRYEDAISSINPRVSTLFVFLGSTVGNFGPEERTHFFGNLARNMGPHDFLLLGADRIKDVEIIRKAYNDSKGVTASFILNALENINRTHGSNFRRDQMRYHAPYNERENQVEMYAVATDTQEIVFPSESVRFTWERDERILVETSRKFDPHTLETQLTELGLEPVAHCTDVNEWFSLLLFRKRNP